MAICHIPIVYITHGKKPKKRPVLSSFVQSRDAPIALGYYADGGSIVYKYNVHSVWKGYEVPLHPGAARYYKEQGYMK